MRFESENVVRHNPFLTLVIVEEFCAREVEQLPSLEPFFFLALTIAFLKQGKYLGSILVHFGEPCFAGLTIVGPVDDPSVDFFKRALVQT